jgi:hypothetical protein
VRQTILPYIEKKEMLCAGEIADRYSLTDKLLWNKGSGGLLGARNTWKRDWDLKKREETQEELGGL